METLCSQLPTSLTDSLIMYRVLRNEMIHIKSRTIYKISLNGKPGMRYKSRALRIVWRVIIWKYNIDLYLIYEAVRSSCEVLCGRDRIGALCSLFYLHQRGTCKDITIKESWSVAEITETRLYEGMKPVRGGIYLLTQDLMTLDSEFPHWTRSARPVGNRENVKDISGI
jgi:hypothetical protein